MRVICFKIWSDFAHFRCHYTTSSPLTHLIPPPSALRGLVAAILGYSREEYPYILSAENSLFGVRVLNPLKKIRLGINYLDTKDESWIKLDLKNFKRVIKKSGNTLRFHTQPRIEFLKNPCFEIYFHHKNSEIMDKLYERLKSKKTVYTPYLGITECIANFEFLWDKNLSFCNKETWIISGFKREDLVSLSLEEGRSIIKETLPCFIDKNRIRQSSVDVIFEVNGKPVKAFLKKAYLYPGAIDLSIAFIG